MKFQSLAGHGPIAIDVETRDPELMSLGPGSHRGAFICGIAIATEKGFKQYFPIRHKRGKNLNRKQVLMWLKRELNHPGQPKVGANLIYDLEMLDAEGVTVAGPYHDIQIAEPLIDETHFRYGLDTLAQRYLHKSKDEAKMIGWIIKHLGVKEKDAKNYIWECPPEIVRDYAIADVLLPLAIWKRQYLKLQRLDLLRLYDTEQALLPVLLHMRKHGVRVDVREAKRLHEQFGKTMHKLQRQLNEIAGLEVQPWAAASIAKAFDGLGLTYELTNKTKKPSFRSAWLKQYNHEIAKLIIEIRKLDKLRNTFLGAIIERHTRGRIYTQFHQLRSDEGGTISGRFSSSGELNLQQIPVRSAEGKLLRNLFLADANKDFGVIDLSQIEFRLMVSDAVEISLDGAEEIAEQFRAGTADFHTLVAEMAGVDRSAAKTINFGIAFGEGATKLSLALGLTQKEGFKFIEDYHTKVPFMRGLMKHYTKLALKERKIRTLYGRLRHFNIWELHGDIQVRRKAPSNEPMANLLYTYRALNARIQGSAADILKRSMVAIHQAGLLDPGRLTLHITCHDELCFSVPRTKQGRADFAEAKRLMEVTSEIAIPIVAEAGIGKSWGEAKH